MLNGTMAMAHNDTADIMKRLQDHAAEWRAFGVLRMDLFGSVARGQAHDDSDVDVLVDLAPGATYEQLFDLRERLQQLLGRPVDVVTRGGVARRPRLLRRIESEALRVA